MQPTSRVLVVEDSPAGIRAGKAAGCQVLGLATTHSIERVREAGADWIVKDLQSVALSERSPSDDAAVVMVISHALE